MDQNVQEDNEVYKTGKRLKNYKTWLPKYFFPRKFFCIFFYFDTHNPTDVEDPNKLDSFFWLTFTAFTHHCTTNARHKHILFIWCEIKLNKTNISSLARLFEAMQNRRAFLESIYYVYRLDAAFMRFYSMFTKRNLFEYIMWVYLETELGVTSWLKLLSRMFFRNNKNVC